MTLSIALLSALACQTPAMAPAAAVPPPRTLAITSTARLDVPPDEATVTVTFTSTARKLSAAHADAKKKIDAFTAAAHAAGVPADGIVFSAANEAAEYVYPEGRPRQLTGFQSTTTLRIEVSDFALVAPVVDAAVDAGVASLDGIEYHSTKLSEHKKKARDMAIEAAKAKADQLAGGLGFTLAGVQSVSERTGDTPWWGPRGLENNVAQAVASAPSSGSDVDTPIVPGSESLTLTLDLVFEIR